MKYLEGTLNILHLIEIKFLIKCLKCLIQSRRRAITVVVLFAALSALSLVFAFQLHTAKDIPELFPRDNNIQAYLRSTQEMFNHQSHCDDCSGYFQSFELCKNVNCNGHGSCVLGVCKCRQGWRGSSCNIASSCATLQCGLKPHEYCYNGNECVCVRGYVRNKVTKACEVPKLVATTTQINIASTTTPAPKFNNHKDNG